MFFLFYITIAFSCTIYANADETDTPLSCESIICPLGSTVCIYNKRSNELRTNVAISISCLLMNGTLMQESDTVIPNPTPQRMTDVTSFTILGMNSTKARQQQFVNAVIDAARKLMNNQSMYPGMMQSPYGDRLGYQPYQGYQGMPGASSPLVVNIPPASAPVITITNMMPPYQNSGYGNFIRRNSCPNPPCINNLPASPSTTSGANGNPNLMPTSLDTIYEKIFQMRNCMSELEKAVEDASAAVPPPTYGPANNVAFPVTMPYSPNVNSFI